MRRADRLFQIVLLLGRGRAVTARTLAERLEVSERTVYRDMADLMASGLQVNGEAGVGYLLRAGAHLPPLMFDREELAALALGSRMVHGWADKALGKAAERALLKIESVLPVSGKGQLERQALLVPAFHIAPGQVAPLGALRGDFRNFRLDRMSAPDVLAETFTPDEGRTLADFLRHVAD